MMRAALAQCLGLLRIAPLQLGGITTFFNLDHMHCTPQDRWRVDFLAQIIAELVVSSAGRPRVLVRADWRSRPPSPSFSQSHTHLLIHLPFSIYHSLSPGERAPLRHGS